MWFTIYIILALSIHWVPGFTCTNISTLQGIAAPSEVQTPPPGNGQNQLETSVVDCMHLIYVFY